MNNFESVWKILSSEFDLSNCIYKNINGRVFIHFPKTKESSAIRVKITRNAQENKHLLYEALDSVITAWLGNYTPINKNVYSRLGPNKVSYCVINFTIINYYDEPGYPIINCIPQKDIEWDDDWDCIWEDEDNPNSYYINEDGIKMYMWTKNWENTFKDDFD